MITTKDLETQYEVNSYARFPMAIKRGEGSYIFDEDDTPYLDLYGGHAVVALGHCYPPVVQAIREQAEKLMFYSNLVYHRERGLAAKALGDLAPEGLKKSFFINSGAEANENAIKVARMKTKREKIISFDKGFHGRTAAAIAATGNPKLRESCQPVLGGHLILPFHHLEAVEKALAKQDVAAILLEPIQSMAGVIEAGEEFLKGLYELCQRYGTLLIYDEVQTAVGRTGRPFYAGKYGIVPHMVTLGKAIASGFPMGAVLFHDDIASQIELGDLGSTFGGGPLASVAMQKTMAAMTDELFSHTLELEEKLRHAAKEISFIKGIRGEGVLLGIELHSAQAKVLQTKLLHEHRIITGLSGDPKVLRLLPPMNTAHEDWDRFLVTLSTMAKDGL